MRFLLFILVCSLVLLKLSLAASLSSSKGSKRTTNDQGYIFSNVYNSGMSSSQGLEILRRMKTVEEKLEKIESKGFIKGTTNVSLIDFLALGRASAIIPFEKT